MLNDRELTRLQETGVLFIYSKFNIGALLASLDKLGIGPEQVEITSVSSGVGVKVTVL